MPLSEKCGAIQFVPKKRSGTRHDLNPVWPDGHREARCIIFIANPTAKTWLYLCFNVPKVFQKGLSKIFNELLKDYWVIIQFLATLKVSAMVITSKVGTESERNPVCILVGGSLVLNYLSILPQGS